jgi:hypothetical protein
LQQYSAREGVKTPVDDYNCAVFMNGKAYRAAIALLHFRICIFQQRRQHHLYFRHTASPLHTRGDHTTLFPTITGISSPRQPQRANAISNKDPTHGLEFTKRRSCGRAIPHSTTTRLLLLFFTYFAFDHRPLRGVFN